MRSLRSHQQPHRHLLGARPLRRRDRQPQRPVGRNTLNHDSPRQFAPQNDRHVSRLPQHALRPRSLRNPFRRKHRSRSRSRAYCSSLWPRGGSNFVPRRDPRRQPRHVWNQWRRARGRLHRQISLSRQSPTQSPERLRHLLSHPRQWRQRRHLLLRATEPRQGPRQWRRQSFVVRCRRQTGHAPRHRIARLRAHSSSIPGCGRCVTRLFSIGGT